MALQLIYHFQASQNQDLEFRPASYGVVYFFSDSGIIDKNLLIEMSKTVPEADHVRLTFLSLDDLKTFALRVGQELSENEVRLISVQDYNIGLDGAKDLKSFQSVFEKYGELIQHENAKKKSLFSKIFS
jgi:hypothetical protein